MNGDPRPVFVVGPPRSGTNLLAWSLGLHPNLLPVLPGTWVAEIGLRAAGTWMEETKPGRHTLLNALGPSLDEFLASIGRGVSLLLEGGVRGARLEERARLSARTAVAPGAATARRAATAPVAEAGSPLVRRWLDGRQLGDGQRWIDGTDHNALLIPALSAMFPAARFIWVHRDAEEVVAALRAGTPADGYVQPEIAAYHEWSRHVAACLEAERALGSGTVRRIGYRDMLGDPERTVRACLDFLGEGHWEACLRPLRNRREDAEAARSGARALISGSMGGPRELPEEAAWVAAEAAASLGRAFSPDAELRDRMLADLMERRRKKGRAQRKHSAVHAIQEVVSASVPAGSTVLVISRGDPELLQLQGRRAWHFPRLDDGTYAGFYPASGEEAVDQLEALRARGAQYLLVPAAAFWWLDHYEAFCSHLVARCPIVAYQQELCFVFSLEGTAAEDRPPPTVTQALMAAAAAPPPSPSR